MPGLIKERSTHASIGDKQFTGLYISSSLDKVLIFACYFSGAQTEQKKLGVAQTAFAFAFGKKELNASELQQTTHTRARMAHEKEKLTQLRRMWFTAYIRTR